MKITEEQKDDLLAHRKQKLQAIVDDQTLQDMRAGLAKANMKRNLQQMETREIAESNADFIGRLDAGIAALETRMRNLER